MTDVPFAGASLDTLSNPATHTQGIAPPPPSVSNIRPANRLTLIAVVAGALATDLSLWTKGPGLLWTLCATAVAVALALATRPSRPGAWAALGAVPLLAIWCYLRTSPWLVVLDVIAINLCLLIGCGIAHRGRLIDTSLPRLLWRLMSLVEDAFLSLPWLGRSIFAREVHRGRHAPRDNVGLVIGLAVTVPLVIVLMLLLSSADAVFASFFNFGLDGSALFRHALFLGGGCVAMATLLRHASATTDGDMGASPRLSATVGTVVLSGVDAVFGLYATSRLLSLSSTGERIAETKGLTWAEYTRSGFFQLLAVAAITLIVLITVLGWCHQGTAKQQRMRRWLALGTVVLVLGIVADALYRLNGYQAAYGLTMLRLYSSVFAVWIAAVFGLVAVAVATGYRGRRWLTSAILSTALVALLGLDIANPEAIVARRNLTGPTKAGETDIFYLSGNLGPDAAPVIDAHIGLLLERLPVSDREMWWNQRCASFGGYDQGSVNSNRSVDRAARLLRGHCE